MAEINQQLISIFVMQFLYWNIVNLKIQSNHLKNQKLYSMVFFIFLKIHPVYLPCFKNTFENNKSRDYFIYKPTLKSGQQTNFSYFKHKGYKLVQRC